VTHPADIQNMPMSSTESVGTVICTAVLEHVPDPAARARDEPRAQARRSSILSVPFLAPIHEAPHDYVRYTRCARLDRAGFRAASF
jgi:hypothetical protein